MALEEILAQVGNSGRFQVMFCGIIISMEIVIAWSMMQTAILGATPKWWCVDPSSLDPVDNTPTLTLTNLTYHTCSPSLPFPPSGSHGQNVNHDTTSSRESTPSCVRYYDPGMVTIISEWDLVCERKYIKAVVNSVQMAGVLVGAVTFGRRVTCYVTMLVHAVTCLVAGFSSSWQMYAACRFFVGASIGSFLVLHYVYMIEFVSHTWRPYLASIPTWPVGAGLMCLTAWRVPHWRYLHFIAAALSVPPLLGWL